MSFAVRAFLSGQAVMALHASDGAIDYDVIRDGVVGVIDAVVTGPYADSAVLFPLASLVGGRLVITGRTITAQTYSSRIPAVAEPMVQSLSLTFRQMLIGLVASGWITRAEGEAWLDGVLPMAVTALIAGLPEAQQFAAIAGAKRPSVVLRRDPLVIALASLQGRTETEMDAFFLRYAAV